MTNVFVTHLGDLVSITVSKTSLQDTKIMKKNASIVIIKKNDDIQMIGGIRAGVIQDAHMRGDYQDTLIWPIRKKNRQIESVLLLCDMKTGKYLAYTEEDAIAKQVNIPEGFEIEFFYTHKKRIQKPKKRNSYLSM